MIDAIRKHGHYVACIALGIAFVVLAIWKDMGPVITVLWILVAIILWLPPSWIQRWKAKIPRD